MDDEPTPMAVSADALPWSASHSDGLWGLCKVYRIALLDDFALIARGAAGALVPLGFEAGFCLLLRVGTVPVWLTSSSLAAGFIPGLHGASMVAHLRLL
jgi:hypothetical protein